MKLLLLLLSVILFQMFVAAQTTKHYMIFKMFDDNRQIYQNYFDRVTRIDSSYSCECHSMSDSIISTEFSYYIGSEEYQNMNIAHDQKLTDLDNIHLLVNKFKLSSSYRNNSFSRDDVILSYNHRNDSSINATTVLRYSNINRDNNWGIILDTGLFDNNVNRSFYSVNSNNSKNSVEMIDWRATIFLPGNIRFGTEVGISRYIFRYNDFDVQESFYSEIILDSSMTSDEFKEGNERIALGLRTNFGLELNFMSGLMRSYYRNYANDTSKVIPYSELELLDTSSGWDLSLISTYKDGIFMNLIWSYGVKSRMSSKFKTQLSFISGSQSEFYSRYNSNHISYTNNVRNITRWEGILTYAISNKMRFGINHSGVLNPYVYNQSSNTIEQSKTLNHISTIRGELKLIEKSKHNLRLSGCYTITQGNYYSYPEVLGRVDYSYSTSFFKDKLPMKFTISPRYVGKYKLLSYRPNINMVYYDGSSIQTDNYYVDFKIEAEIGGIGLNLGVLHLNQGLSSKSYYDFVGMPGIDRIITFGVSVNFYD